MGAAEPPQAEKRCGMSSRILTDSDRQRRIAERRLQTVAGQHSAVGVITRYARAGYMDPDRALALISALCDGHAVAHWLLSTDGEGARLTITADPDAPANVRELLQAAQLPALDRAERDMIDALKGGGAA
jgi:hypothetical protein